MSDLAEQHRAELERGTDFYTTYRLVCACGYTTAWRPRAGLAQCEHMAHLTDLGIRPKERTP